MPVLSAPNQVYMQAEQVLSTQNQPCRGELVKWAQSVGEMGMCLKIPVQERDETLVKMTAAWRGRGVPQVAPIANSNKTGSGSQLWRTWGLSVWFYPERKLTSPSLTFVHLDPSPLEALEYVLPHPPGFYVWVPRKDWL